MSIQLDHQLLYIDCMVRMVMDDTNEFLVLELCGCNKQQTQINQNLNQPTKSEKEENTNKNTYALEFHNNPQTDFQCIRTDMNSMVHDWQRNIPHLHRTLQHMDQYISY